MLSRLLRNLAGPAAPDTPPAEATATAHGPSNPLADYFFNNPGRPVTKWHHYFDIYHRHFERFRGRSPVVVEIGVKKGGSLQMWHAYFGPGCKVVGIDIDGDCARFEDASTTILIGDQADRGFLASVRARVPHIDILIDDGGHTMAQQNATFEELYPHLDRNGIYLCEDVHTSLIPKFGGSIAGEDTFLNRSKALVSRLYGWYSRDQSVLKVDDFTLSTHSLHFYDSVVVIEKRPKETPAVSETGREEH